MYTHTGSGVLDTACDITVVMFLYAGVVKMIQAKLRSRETKLF